MLPVMALLTGNFPDYEFVVAGAPSVDPVFYTRYSTHKGLKILFGQTHELLRHSYAAMVTSGTATLEAALFNVPQVVCYKGSAISFAIARRIVDVKYISLVNLIMDRKVVTELIQGDFNPGNLLQELTMLLVEKKHAQVVSDYKLLRVKLGGEGASCRSADEIIKFLAH
jgi:lipid-A-disaccharide synthase